MRLVCVLELLKPIITLVNCLLQIYAVRVLFANMCDTFLSLRKRRNAVLGLLCLGAFLLGLPLTRPKYLNYAFMLENTIIFLPKFIVIFLELLAVVWFYGYSQFLADMEDMVGSQVFGGRVTFKHYAVWLTFSWVYLSQVLAFLQIVWLMVNFQQKEEQYKMAERVCRGVFLAIVLLPIPATVLYDVLTRPKGVTVRERLEMLTVASERWGPALLKDRYKWINTLFSGTLHVSFCEGETSWSADQPESAEVRRLPSQRREWVTNLFRAKFLKRNRRVSVTDCPPTGMTPITRGSLPLAKPWHVKEANSNANQTGTK
jgi:hypothetical protein